ncbi:hypothetical protein ACRAWD_03420 [Caulobacter segnis]
MIYDEHGLSARVAYNWREPVCLQATNRGGPGVARSASNRSARVDFSVSYDVNAKLSEVSFEGINLTNEHLRTYARGENELWFRPGAGRTPAFPARRPPPLLGSEVSFSDRRGDRIALAAVPFFL